MVNQHAVPIGSRSRRKLASLAASLPVLATLLGSPTGAAEREGLDAQTKATLQSVITGQLQAFEKGDATAAEAFAAPAIKQRFPQPSQFLDMVKQQYGALIHPRSTQFLDVVDSPRGPLQKMIVIAADGTVWSAIYSFEKVDGLWRITGCGLEKDDTQQEI